MSETQDQEQALREAICAVMRAMEQRGLNRGTSGNVSARWGDGLLVTPSGVPAQDLTPQSIVRLDAAGAAPEGALRPSSEWRMHAGLYARRSDVNAVVHCHSRYATILACAGRPIPPAHYMISVSGKATVPVAPYQPFGTAALADTAAIALEGGYACLLANHGLVAVSKTLGRALAIAEEVEEQAAVYHGALAIGGPNLLSEAQMADIFQRFKDYGQG